MAVYTVGQVNKYIKNILTQDYILRSISIQGEVSNCKYHSLGHVYFSLKDETGSIPAVMFKSDVDNNLKFKLENGQSVVIGGSISVYERDGRYQLYAKTIKLQGVGSLYEQFERLKYQLNEEGLFDPDNRKPIPKYPKTVGIVTAKTGAAIQDIMNVARRRNPYVQLILYPAKVQGEGAAETIVKGIQTLDAMNLDTIIIGRGGGSMEELWAFNEEPVVRAIYAAKTPIISGVGHEVDITLSDYAADLRAPTPSAACELAIPDMSNTLIQLRSVERAICNCMDNKLALAKSRISQLDMRLNSQNPILRLEQQKQYLADCYDAISRAMRQKFEYANNRYQLLLARLNGASPTAKLVGGFGYAEANGHPIEDVRTVKAGDSLELTVKSGLIRATVEDVIVKEIV
ncbi:MAG: exodeoxyribonuclease VII large subunit [Lachnospiraceae bacterium]|nr:exodeoxyribonuclease VII large subunit [Lachnospiraceae bacterium]